MESRDLDSNEVCNSSCKYNTVIIMFIIATEKKNLAYCLKQVCSLESY